MISAIEALQLPTAQLKAEEKKAADELEQNIENGIRECMQFFGAEITLKCTNPNIIVEVVMRLKKAGFSVQYTPRVEKNRFNPASQEVVGYIMKIMPNDDAYRAVSSIVSA